jgi:hypothetical protein
MALGGFPRVRMMTASSFPHNGAMRETHAGNR